MKRSQIKRRPLADTVLASLEPEDKDYRELDGQGLYFRVKRNGAKSWELRYRRPNGRWSWKGLGGFPGKSGKAARREAEDLRRLAADGIDLAAVDREAKPRHLFAEIAEDWYQRKLDAGRSLGTTRQMRLYLDRDILPALGRKPLDEITRQDCTELQRAFEDRGAHNIAEKVRSWVGQIFSLAIAEGKCEMNPASELRHVAATPPKTTHYPHLLEAELPGFLQALNRSRSRPITVAAVWMVLRTASRPGMVRYAEWSEIDLEAETWTIPAEKMKTRRDHVVALPKQTVASLRDVFQQTGRRRLVFPGQGPKHPVLGNSTLNQAIGRVGYKGKLTGHGSRHTASTLLREHGWPKDHVEVQLAHKEPGVAGVYNQASYLKHRRRMMQWYSDYLDALCRGITDEEKATFKKRVEEDDQGDG
ncbi:tyrosine-type recombinase/integrase [Halomonas eurihalina]|uniref:Tyrosine-type recombinase/integrase n=1 Tax=Halomonas eurihalina TaxID=42566 RepID=A0A5D9DES2_HALER|nr:tyrosine-type recombinase/integrase [Halomonas eurihalina]MDR5858233.1 tyrosine-type recombinase/integrase [Halomonas eurihalina]TZG41271.1 tyrosine-type recombinase/integrase [Halomonas eurihalina]